MKRIVFFIIIVLILPAVYGQRNMEQLDRGLVAVKTGGGIFLSWRVTGQEWVDVEYNVYKNGVKINVDPVSQSSNYLDASGTLSDLYSVSAIVSGVEKERSNDVSVWAGQYSNIPINRPPGGTSPDGAYTYAANDGSMGDVDGDGDMEIILKWDPSNSHDNAHEGYTGDVIIDAYTLEGTQLWRINLGKNIRAGAHYTQFIVYDLDGDGKAEVACKTADGTTDGLGNVIGNPLADYRNSVGRILTGPEFLTVFDGQTGEALKTIDYEPARGNVGDWGDTYGNRVDRFLACAAYLDGEHASLVMCRGYYERTMLAAYDWKNGELTKRWLFNSEAGGLTEYSGQGNHNLSVADVDNDGKDEIVYGAMTIDDDGTGLYSTRLGHGDALHVSDMDPDYPGIEVFSPHESGGNGATFRETKTGKIIWQHRANYDVGRGVAADVFPEWRGFEAWASGLGVYNSQGDYVTSQPNSTNFAIYWDGDLSRELLNNTSIMKVSTTILTDGNVLSCNGSKSTPVLQADILGDWREEVIWRGANNEYLRIYTTTNLTTHRIYSLLHDPQYRAAIAWQNVAYNQPPHHSFYFEKNMALPLPPVYQGLKWKGNAVLNTWNTSDLSFINNEGTDVSFSDGDTVIFGLKGEYGQPVMLSETLSPGLVVVSSSFDISIEGEGKLSGEMSLYKSQKGSLTLEGDHLYTGKTMVSDGALIVNGSIETSKVFVSGGVWGGKNSSPNQGGRIGGSGKLKGGLVIQNRGALVPGYHDADTLFVENGLNLQKYSVGYFDLSGTGEGINDMVVITGDLTIEEGVELKFNLLEGEIDNKDYILFSYSGELIGTTSNFNVTGLEQFFYEIVAENAKIILRRPVTRDPASLTWSGAENNYWDLSAALNWNLKGAEAFFLPQDSVLFDNSGSAQNEIYLSGLINVSNISHDASTNYTLTGDGTITGKGGLLKKGTGELKIQTINTYTGSTVIEEGVLIINKLLNGENPSNIGSPGSDPGKLTLNGGELEIKGSSASDKGVFIGPNGASLNLGGAQELTGLISGSGLLRKKGLGSLGLLGANNFEGGTIIEGGTVKMLNDDANAFGLGSGEITIINGTLEQFDSRNSYNTTQLSLNIPEYANATYILDGRVTNRDNLRGSGKLNIHVNFVRTEFVGDWSDFNGHLVVIADNDGGDFRVNNKYGYPNTKIEFKDQVLAYHLNSDTIQIGELSGSSGATLKSAIWKVGSLNTNSKFSGNLEGNALIKEGSGRLILSGNSNTYTGGTIVEKGSLWVQNTSGSATGTGIVTIKSNAVLGGAGIISGLVVIEGGGYLSPGDLIGSIEVESSVQMEQNSILNIELSTENNSADQLITGDLILNSTVLFLMNTSANPYEIGDQFPIIKATNIIGEFKAIYPVSPGEGLVWDTDLLYTSGIVKVAAAQSTGFEKSNTDGLMIYPNPSAGLFNIKMYDLDEKIERISVFDINGSKVLELQPESINQSYLIDLSFKTEGLYIVKIITANNSYIRRLYLN